MGDRRKYADPVRLLPRAHAAPPSTRSRHAAPSPSSSSQSLLPPADVMPQPPQLTMSLRHPRRYADGSSSLLDHSRSGETSSSHRHAPPRQPQPVAAAPDRGRDDAARGGQKRGRADDGGEREPAKRRRYFHEISGQGSSSSSGGAPAPAPVSNSHVSHVSHSNHSSLSSHTQSSQSSLSSTLSSLQASLAIKIDKEHHLVAAPGEVIVDDLGRKYRVIGRLGKGTFGTVYSCKCPQGNVVALKVIRARSKYRDAGEVERDILDYIHDRRARKESCLYCVNLVSDFSYLGHFCMVFPKMGQSLFDMMYKRNHAKPMPLPLLIMSVYQLLRGVQFLHKHNLIHTDLKPENILWPDSYYVENSQFRNKISSYIGPWGDESYYEFPERPRLCIIDFGSATFNDAHKTKIITTRHYRAPEVILGLGWSFPSDIWSVGCIFYEAMCGELLFATHDDYQHMAMMERRVGKVPMSMVRNTRNHCKEYFDSAGTVIWPRFDGKYDDDYKYQRQVTRLERLQKEDLFPGVQVQGVFVSDIKELLLSMLCVDPRARITADSALAMGVMVSARVIYHEAMGYA